MILWLQAYQLMHVHSEVSLTVFHRNYSQINAHRTEAIFICKVSITERSIQISFSSREFLIQFTQAGSPIVDMSV